jgi:hypothetical protein
MKKQIEIRKMTSSIKAISPIALAENGLVMNVFVE